MSGVNGLHHVTAMATQAQRNLDFYAGVLGMRLVKRSVNQDDPGTYHLFYADAEGRPGTDLTFFPWENLAAPRKGTGMAVEVQLAVPHGSLEFWATRLQRYGVRVGEVEVRFGERALPFQDPDGLEVALVETGPRPFTPWEGSTIPEDKQIMGLHGARLWERELYPTAQFLSQALGFVSAGQEKGWNRFVVNGGGSGNFLDIKELPNLPQGRWGRGSIHHLAWRVEDTAHEMAVRARIEAAGMRATPQIDRFWFKSVYFNEPGGALFELATDGPGFAVDEDPAHLGEKLVLPPWLEPARPRIEARLPELRLPTPEVWS
ncbi:ring-cleaving dioxygenase [Meiothermus taiwanensis]|jgi:glyoxalase family protein|uniref:Glyoxalase/bleomycin resistance protein/dioxygenase n=2 Tax=Meiothermus taiwanensis TaxID=172827 RepID=A0ABM6WLZ0_9DEIN|nr:ring-cleaving dioxygenase [Meiothermus taiwanensis]AWR88031.1 glyoxalase/bleomycin resistance protein/dioxygenase [Meiothermus taiwanensis WR-220]KIQ53700.1 glyoxalase [Meiothermus taiwanensis]KZK14678.1 glyoxalase [Meiothermus taiwanensis]RIH74773.1 putative ring-cleaving dioxygenase MhqO [Meiothermus taiwanensis]